MTLEEKIENFKICALKDAEMQGEALIYDSENNIKKRLEEYEKKAKEDYERKLKVEMSMIVSQNNQDILKENTKIRQKIENRRLELVDGIFNDLEKKIIAYKKTEEYVELLKRQINEAKSISKDSSFIVYIDKTDADLLDQLSQDTDAKIVISDNNIIGGIKIVIEEKKLLLDYSFRSKIEEERANFVL